MKRERGRNCWILGVVGMFVLFARTGQLRPKKVSSRLFFSVLPVCVFVCCVDDYDLAAAAAAVRQTLYEKARILE